MSVSRAILPVFVALVSACATRTTVETQKPLIPRDGPRGSVRVHYVGGLFNRRATALFRVEQPAHVLVAHLGGDGVIRVLFPEDGRTSGWVSARRTFRTSVFSGDYDAAPGYWFMRTYMFRTPGARHYSYDGRGHGFVFMITSDRPLHFDRISDFGLWDDFEVSNYSYSADPRVAIRQFAELLSGTDRHSVQYASSYGSLSSDSYAQTRMDCAILSSDFHPYWFGLSGYGSWASGYAMSPWSYSSRGMGGCGRYASNRYADLFGPWNFGPRRSDWTRPVTTAAAPPPILPPVNIPAHRIPRPGRRDEAAGGSTLSLTPTTFAQPGGTGGREWDRRGRESPSGGRTPTSAESARPSAPPSAPPSTSASPAPAASPPVRPTGALSERPAPVKRDP